MSESIVYKPIGVIRSGHIKPEETTRNGWQDEVDEETAQLRGRRAR